MNRKEKFQIENAIWRAQAEIVPVCIICHNEMNLLDAKSGYAICWSCRKQTSPERKTRNNIPVYETARIIDDDGTDCSVNCRYKKWFWECNRIKRSLGLG